MSVNQREARKVDEFKYRGQPPKRGGDECES